MKHTAFWALLLIGLLALLVAGIIMYSNRITHCASSAKRKVEARNFPRNELSPAEKTLFLTLHNQTRQKNGADPLHWDERLADSAQAYADKLLQEDCAIRHPQTPEEDKEYLQNGLDGQNLSQFVYEGNRNKKAVGSIAKAVQLWTDECDHYDPEHPTNAKVGHFTQMIWKDTKQLGCAYRHLDRPGKKASIYVCHYHKAGNRLTSKGGLDHYRANIEPSPVCSLGSEKKIKT